VQELVIILDDDVSLLKALDRLLRVYGFGVQSFASINDFVEQARLAEALCLVLDIHLKGGSAVSLRRSIANRGIAIPVIFMTADQSDGLRAEAYEAGCVAYLRKPFAAASLLQAIKDVQGKKLEVRVNS
jgi:FixJ family two-component response regulator